MPATLTPNIRLIKPLQSTRLLPLLRLLLRPRTIGINPALNLCEPLLMLMHHPEDGYHSAHKNRNDGNQVNPKSEDPIHQHFHAPPPASTDHSQRQLYGGADRDRTGGLLVANQALSQLSYSPI
jgi:hypothetical protein